MVDPADRCPLEGDDRVPRAPRRPDRQAARHLRQSEDGMTPDLLSVLGSLPQGVTLEAFTDIDFWTGVGVVAGTYALVALGLQLNVGFTGIVNFGQAAFMLGGAYTMAILVLKADFSFWVALPVAMLVTMLFGVIVGLPSLRLRADYFAIATI